MSNRFLIYNWTVRISNHYSKFKSQIKKLIFKFGFVNCTRYLQYFMITRTPYITHYAANESAIDS
jgi:hypothetical protein